MTPLTIRRTYRTFFITGYTRAENIHDSIGEINSNKKPAQVAPNVSRRVILNKVKTRKAAIHNSVILTSNTVSGEDCFKRRLERGLYAGMSSPTLGRVLSLESRLIGSLPEVTINGSN